MSWINDPILEASDIDEETRRLILARDNEKRKRKNVLVVTLLVVLIASWMLFQKNYLSQEAFELIWTALIGGFIGAAITYLVAE